MSREIVIVNVNTQLKLSELCPPGTALDHIVPFDAMYAINEGYEAGAIDRSYRLSIPYGWVDYVCYARDMTVITSSILMLAHLKRHYPLIEKGFFEMIRSQYSDELEIIHNIHSKFSQQLRVVPVTLQSHFFPDLYDMRLIDSGNFVSNYFVVFQYAIEMAISSPIGIDFLKNLLSIPNNPIREFINDASNQSVLVKLGGYLSGHLAQIWRGCNYEAPSFSMLFPVSVRLSKGREYLTIDVGEVYQNPHNCIPVQYYSEREKIRDAFYDIQLEYSSLIAENPEIEFDYDYADVVAGDMVDDFIKVVDLLNHYNQANLEVISDNESTAELVHDFRDYDEFIISVMAQLNLVRECINDLSRLSQGYTLSTSDSDDDLASEGDSASEDGSADENDSASEGDSGIDVGFNGSFRLLQPAEANNGDEQERKRIRLT